MTELREPQHVEEEDGEDARVHDDDCAANDDSLLAVAQRVVDGGWCGREVGLASAGATRWVGRVHVAGEKVPSS